ncbi:protein phosphatase inhibitor [Ancylostoma duodenale]|uniref:E3 ubiquitin-protein ligase PPP1R11 n=1 Tax=Ancylostoma duodenale TaxID=51022 RepID=A0A0C2GNU3_9BILA|nr:protein phosphatase inhibitor [Ancylostoma duodenale]
MESSATVLTTEVITEERQNEKEDLVLRLRSAPADDGPHVTWAPDVIDNEHLGRLKSNCCCIYTRPRVWDDPSTWEQDEAETEHCRGHTLPPPRKPDSDDSGNPKDHNEEES